MPLFEVAILERPTKKEVEEQGAVEKLVFGPEPVVAKDAQSAGIAAVMGKTDMPEFKMERAQVLVRPFA